MSKWGFFASSLVAALPAALLVFLIVKTFMSESSPEGLLMVVVGTVGLVGLVIALIIPGYIMLFVPKSGVMEAAGPAPNADTGENAFGEEDFVGDEFGADDEFGETAFDEDFEEPVMAEEESGGDEWDDFDEFEKS